MSFRVSLLVAASMFITIPLVYAADPLTAKVEGVYTAKGEDISGVKYTATVEIKEEGDAFRVTWKYANGVSFIGIGLRDGKKLSVSWAGAAGEGKVMVGVMVYEIQKDGTLEGKWTILGAKGKVKTETLAPSI